MPPRGKTEHLRERQFPVETAPLTPISGSLPLRDGLPELVGVLGIRDVRRWRFVTLRHVATIVRTNFLTTLEEDREMGFADITNTVLEFVRQHPNWSAFIVFGLSFGESLPFVSLVLPFWAMLVGIGTIIAVADPLIFWTIVAAAAIGAALGDWLSYWLGYHYHAQIQQMWPLKNHPKLLDKGRVFFKRWGAWGIVIARFSGPLRASVPIVAGIAEMPWLRFQIANWSSAFLWAFVLLSPGSWGMKWWTQYFS